MVGRAARRSVGRGSVRAEGDVPRRAFALRRAAARAEPRPTEPPTGIDESVFLINF